MQACSCLRTSRARRWSVSTIELSREFSGQFLQIVAIQSYLAQQRERGEASVSSLVLDGRQYRTSVSRPWPFSSLVSDILGHVITPHITTYEISSTEQLVTISRDEMLHHLFPRSVASVLVTGWSFFFVAV